MMALTSSANVPGISKALVAVGREGLGLWLGAIVEM
jgi:hypothetical protein